MHSFSYSQLASYETCPKRYEFAYIQKIPMSPNTAASFGSSIHNTLNNFYKLNCNRSIVDVTRTIVVWLIGLVITWIGWR